MNGVLTLQQHTAALASASKELGANRREGCTATSTRQYYHVVFDLAEIRYIALY